MSEIETMAVKCAGCGGDLGNVEGHEFVACPYCQTLNRIVGTVATVQEVKGTVETVKGNAFKEQRLKNAATFLMLNKEEEAKKIYREIIDNFPEDYRGWLGLAQLKMNRLSAFITSLPSSMRDVKNDQRVRFVAPFLEDLIALLDSQKTLKILDQEAYRTVCEFEEKLVQDYFSLGLSSNNKFIYGMFESYDNVLRCSDTIQKWVFGEEDRLMAEVEKGEVMFLDFYSYMTTLSPKLQEYSKESYENARFLRANAYLVPVLCYGHRTVLAKNLKYCIGKTFGMQNGTLEKSTGIITAQRLRNMLRLHKKPLSYCKTCGWKIFPMQKYCPVCGKYKPHNPPSEY